MSIKFLLHSLMLILTVSGSLATAANITVSSSRNPVSLDDSFHLVYEADSSVDDDPDFTPVYQYFDVLSSSQSTNMRSVNGNWSLKKTWDLSVIAKDIGTVTVPAINFGKDSSPAIQIKVTNSTSPNSTSSNGQATIPAKLFVEASIDKKTGWIQSQFVYTVRLFRTVTLIGASMSEPTTSDPDAIVGVIGEDEYQSTRNGIRYNVFERRYTIFPQKSGQLKINPVTFEGRVQATQPKTIFDQFRMSGQLKRLRSNQVTVDVKPAPQQVNLQDWLPARNLTLVEDWSGDINNIRAGEPITRTVTIVAEGLSAVQLPDLTFDDINDLKQYPDKAVVENRPDSTGITGLKQIKVALIPASAGSYTLPEIKLEWWNTQTSQKAITTLPETVLTVTGSVKENTYSESPPQSMQSQGNKNTTATISPTTLTSTITVSDEPYWKWISLLLAISWLITLLLLFKKSGDRKPERKASKPDSAKNLALKVKRYIKDENLHETKHALIQWAKVFYTEESITNLAQIRQRCTPSLAQAIKQLDESLYSPENPDWQRKKLLAAFLEEQQLDIARPGSHDSALKPLYGK